jgi:hypothetical protein
MSIEQESNKAELITAYQRVCGDIDKIKALGNSLNNAISDCLNNPEFESLASDNEEAMIESAEALMLAIVAQ